MRWGAHAWRSAPPRVPVLDYRSLGCAPAAPGLGGRNPCRRTAPHRHRPPPPRPRRLRGGPRGVDTAAVRRWLSAGARAPSAAQAPGFYRFKVGGLTATTLHDGYLRRPAVGRSLVHNAEPAELQAALRESFVPTTHFDIPITVTSVETPRGLVAFDGGTGGQVTPTAAGLEVTMRAAGLDPARVALVAGRSCLSLKLRP
jgi:hypothetical protein